MRSTVLRSILIVHLAVIVLMSLTGIIPLLLGSAPRGWVLFFHATFAGIYIVSLASIALGFAGASYLNTLESTTLAMLLWAGVLTVGTMFFAMTSLIGTEGQHLLIAIHRWSSIGAAGLGILFVTLGLLHRWPRIPDLKES